MKCPLRMSVGVLVLLWAGVSGAAPVPNQMHLQGSVATSGGSPANGDFDMVLRLFTAETGGTPLWSQTKSDVPVMGGIFDVELTGLPGGLFADSSELWLETVVQGEVLPRQRLLAVGYALQAEHANTATAATSLACTACVTGAQVKPGALTGAHLIDGSVGADDVGFTYAGSADKGGAANDVACPGCVGSSDLGVTWALGATKGGAAAGLACSGCVDATDIAGGSVTSAHIQDGSISAVDVGFDYAASTSPGGPAIGLECGDRCVGGGELALDLSLDGGLSVAGALNACKAGSAGCSVTLADGGGLFYPKDGWLSIQSKDGVRVRTLDGSAYGPLEIGSGEVHGDLTVEGGTLQVDGGLVRINGAGTPDPLLFQVTGGRSGFTGPAGGNNYALIAIGNNPGFTNPENAGHQSQLYTWNGSDSNGSLAGVDFGTSYYQGGAHVSGFTGARIAAQFPGVSNANTDTELVFVTRGTGGFKERMRIGKSGFLGIGTKTPTAMLHVAGDLRVDGTITGASNVSASLLLAPRTLYLPLNQAGSSGQVVHDFSGRLQDGVLGFNAAAGGDDPVWTLDGRVGGALEFDGVDDRVTIPSSETLNMRGSFAVSAWIRRKAAGTGLQSEDYQMIASKHFTHWARSWDLYLAQPEGRVPYFGIEDVNNAAYGLAVTDMTVQDGVWYHVAGVFDKKAGTMRIYVDGVDHTPPGQGNVGPVEVMVSSVPVMVGAYCNSNDGSVARTFFNGTIDEVMLFDRALSAAEVKALYLAGTAQ